MVPSSDLINATIGDEIESCAFHSHRKRYEPRQRHYERLQVPGVSVGDLMKSAINPARMSGSSSGKKCPAFSTISKRAAALRLRAGHRSE
jgi:hypothetical protein